MKNLKEYFIILGVEIYLKMWYHMVKNFVLE